MSLHEVRQALNDPRARLEGNDPDVPLNECAYFKSAAIPENLGFMFAKGRVVRIDVFGPGILTATGVGVGDSEDKIKSYTPAASPWSRTPIFQTLVTT